MCVAVLLLLAATFFGSNRSFGAFLLSVPALIILLLAFGAAVAVSKSGQSRTIAALAVVGLSPVAYLYSYGIAQQARFLLWAPAHYSELKEASQKNGIVGGWDSWGMAGQDTFSYLVVDTQDRLRAKGRISQWTKQVGQTCGIWESRRVWPKFYIVTTYTNCPYDRIEPAD